MAFKLELTKLPFQPRTNQIIYVESNYNYEINDYIQQHYNELKERLSPKYEFVYIPYLYKEVDLNSIVQYYAPYTLGVKVEWDQLNMRSDYLLNYMKYPGYRDYVGTALVKYSRKEGKPRVFRGEWIGNSSQIDLCIQELTKQPIVEEIRFDLKPEHKPQKHEIVCFKQVFVNPLTDKYTINDEVERIIRQTKDNISQLRKMGIGEKILQQLFYEEEKLSRLVITQNYRIFLPDYNNIEIELRPLPKAVFFLFLNHPEGINFSYLPDYYEEIKGYYMKTKGTHKLTDAMQNNLRRVTNPLDNSINEKCTRIKEAFIRKFDDRLARNYYISGEWGCPKSISLHRELVEWEK